MKKILYSLQVIWAVFYFFNFIFFFLLLYPPLRVFLSREEWYFRANELRRIWAFTIFFFSGLPYSIERRSKLDRKRPYVYCPNHFSYLDIPLAALASYGNIRFMAKMELTKIPVFNIFFRTVDIAVNRGSKTDSYRAQKQAEESLERGQSLVIFPEGTIGEHPPHLLRFKNGPFKLAIDKQAPIVPVTLINNWDHLNVEGKIIGKPGFLKAVVHEPIETIGMTDDDLEMLKEKVSRIIHEELRKHWPDELHGVKAGIQ